MSDKKAFIFDTNFIVQNKKLDEVINNLSTDFIVYIPQVVIDERIAQQCRKLKTLFDEVEEVKNKYKNIATVTLNCTYDEKEKNYSITYQKKCDSEFGNHIIPFSKDSEMLSAILNRAYKKTAPFLSDDNASDKGFKDAILWESILAYFKNKGEKDVVFITDDKGFQKNVEYLCSEFKEKTGKTISIYTNEYYKEFQNKDLTDESKEKAPKNQTIDLEDIRGRIKTVFNRFCYKSIYDNRWGYMDVPTFSISKQVDVEYVSNMLDLMEWEYSEHILETELWASQLMDLDDRFKDGDERIEISAVEDVLRLKKQIQENASDYIQQFYEAVASIINQRYVKTKDSQTLNEIDEDDLPF